MREKLYVSIPTVMLYERDFSLMEIGVYYGVKSFRNAKTGKCYPSHRTIADRIGAGLNTVKRAISKFELAGLINIKRTDSSSHYSFPEVDVKGSTLVPQDLYEKLDAKEVGFYAILLSFRNNDIKLCNVPLDLVCDRASINKKNGTASAYIQSLQEKDVLVATRTNRAYSFAFPTLTFDSELEVEKSLEYTKANETKSIKPSNIDYTLLPTTSQVEIATPVEEIIELDILEDEVATMGEKVANMEDVVIVENTRPEYEDEEEEYWAYQSRFNKAHGVVYKPKKEEPKKKQNKALDLLLGGNKNSKITY